MRLLTRQSSELLVVVAAVVIGVVVVTAAAAAAVVITRCYCPSDGQLPDLESATANICIRRQRRTAATAAYLAIAELACEPQRQLQFHRFPANNNHRNPILRSPDLAKPLLRLEKSILSLKLAETVCHKHPHLTMMALSVGWANFGRRSLDSHAETCQPS